jgi:hypothetical protein
MGGTYLLTAASLLSGLWPFHHERQVVTERYVIPAWHIDSTRDKFTHAMTCRVYQGARKKPSVAYYHGALAFRFAHKLNTTQAAFQVDSGEVRPWTAVYPELIGTGARVAGRSMDNPTDGVVMLPVSVLAQAQTVTIRPTQQRRPWRFAIGGFSDALKAGVAQGCDPQTGFII